MKLLSLINSGFSYLTKTTAKLALLEKRKRKGQGQLYLRNVVLKLFSFTSF